MRLIQRLRSRLALPAGALLLLLLPACTGGTPTGVVDGTPIPALGSEAVTTRLDCADILAAEVRGNRLHVQVRFGGGCTAHEFSLVRTGGVVETRPVQIYLQLTHDAKANPCRALLTRDLTFDLSSFKTAYHWAPNSRGMIVFHLRAPGSGESHAAPLWYQF